MTRGTTPIHNFILPFDTSDVYSIQVIYTQINLDPDKTITVSKTWECENNDTAAPSFDRDRIIFDGNEVRVGLTAAETYEFDPKHFLKIQLSVTTKKRSSNISTDASGNYTESISEGEIYKSAVTYLAVLEDLENPFPANPAKNLGG
jgi:hypothetical protein